ncbi:MAG: hypothetical protein FWD14_07705 [Treponema sp.]|nr:hypothetical protein [Treponema sp.]
MKKTSLVCLDLRTPITYIEGLSQGRNTEGTGKIEEMLFCYELNPLEIRKIDPDKERFLGTQIFVGHKTNQEAHDSFCELPLCEPKNEVSLPIGRYLFMQIRADAVLNREEWLDLAIEQQKDGLWERHKPANILFVRFLHEDGAFVTQVFRPITA